MKWMRNRSASCLTLISWLCITLLSPPSALACTTLKIKADSLVLNPPIPGSGGFYNLNFAQTYVNPIVFALPTNQNPDPAAIRIRNVTNSGCQVAVVEPPGSDGPNTGMTLNYLVAEAGTYTLPSGHMVEIGIVNTAQMQSRYIGTGSATLNFSNSYASPPAVLVQIQTTANEPGISPAMPSSPWMTATAFNITNTTAQLALERSEDTSGSVTLPEGIGYMVIQSGMSGTFLDNGGNTITCETLRSAQNIVGWDNNCVTNNFAGNYPPQPIALANKATRNGSDGGWLRRCRLNPNRIGLQVDEDQANDSERGHATEIASIVLFSQSFQLLMGTPLMEAGTTTVPPTTAGVASFTSVPFSPPFTSTPVIFALPTDQGTSPAALRIRNITAMGFEIAAVEPTGEPGPHPSMSVAYVAALPGIHTLPDGSILEAGTVSTAAYQAGIGGSTGWASINFSTVFSTPPAVLLQIQSTNSEVINPSQPSVPWLTVAARNITSTNMNVALERAEAIAGTVSSETIGYLAMAGNTQSSFLDTDGNGVQCEAMLTTSNIQGWDNGCYGNSFNNTYAAVPVAVAHQSSRNGGNGGWLRRCNLTAGQIGLTVDEDRANDTERSHISEQASVLAFSQPFEACWMPQINMEKSVTVIRDPVNGTTNPKSIPGAHIQYLLDVSNDGSGRADTDTVIVSDPLDGNLAMFVGDLDGSGSPIRFTNGTGLDASGLSYTFISLASDADDIEFSDDNGLNFDYDPSPDTDGFDSDVTNFRITLSGEFLPADIGVQPSFQVEFRARVQ